MSIPVTDVRSNPNDQIFHAVKVLGRSKHRVTIFEAIYRGKKRIKTVSEISETTRLSRVRVLQEARLLADNHIVHQTRHSRDTAYEKDPFYAANKGRILRLNANPKQLARFPTKVNPRLLGQTMVSVNLPRAVVRATPVTIDDIDSFARVRKVKIVPNISPLRESKLKAGIQNIIGEQGRFTDWGGEKNDLFTTRLRVKGRRRLAAFQLKGIGIRGKLTPAKMGKNATQIQRLFTTAADVFIVQYHDQIDESVVEQMAGFAKAISAVEGRRVFYGVIDGEDSRRLITAYKRAFNIGSRRRSHAAARHAT